MLQYKRMVKNRKNIGEYLDEQLGKIEISILSHISLIIKN